MRYLPVCVLLIALCLPTTSTVLSMAILCIATFWMIICATQPTTPFINYLSQVVDPFTEWGDGSNVGGPFTPDGPPNADGGDFDYD